RLLAQPVDGAERHAPAGERALRPDDDAAPLRVEAEDVERLGRGEAEAAALADREVDDAVMAAEDTAGAVDDVAGRRRVGPQAFDEPGIGAARHEADILAVRLRRDRQGEARRESPRLRLAHGAEREAQEIELPPRRREEEVALVALGIGGAVQLG